MCEGVNVRSHDYSYGQCGSWLRWNKSYEKMTQSSTKGYHCPQRRSNFCMPWVEIKCTCPIAAGYIFGLNYFPGNANELEPDYDKFFAFVLCCQMAGCMSYWDEREMQTKKFENNITIVTAGLLYTALFENFRKSLSFWCSTSSKLRLVDSIVSDVICLSCFKANKFGRAPWNFWRPAYFLQQGKYGEFRGTSSCLAQIRRNPPSYAR